MIEMEAAVVEVMVAKELLRIDQDLTLVVGRLTVTGTVKMDNKMEGVDSILVSSEWQPMDTIQGKAGVSITRILWMKVGIWC